MLWSLTRRSRPWLLGQVDVRVLRHGAAALGVPLSVGSTTIAPPAAFVLFVDIASSVREDLTRIRWLLGHARRVSLPL